MVFPRSPAAALVGDVRGTYPHDGPAQLKGSSELAGPLRELLRR
ncbi:hypothetical protein [Streptomyces sp. ATCC 21386]|nr:hypothetical protein [Streptomyces sp. ATCC 21386]